VASLKVIPPPVLTAWADNGSLSVGALLYTIAAGGVYPGDALATYTDAAGGTPNANPVQADSAGRFPPIYLLPKSYRFTLKTSAGVQLWDRDGISGGGETDVDVSGTAGGTLAATLTAGQAVYLSDGSGGLTAGTWNLALSTNAYASSAAQIVGFVVADVIVGNTGTFRIRGRMTGFTGLTIGQTYKISAPAGSIIDVTSTTTNTRIVGMADTTTSLVINPHDADVAWTAGTFEPTEWTATGGGTWTVTSGDVTAYRYLVEGRTITLDIFTKQTTVAGVVTALNITNLPFTPAKPAAGACIIYDNTATAFEIGQWSVDTGVSTIVFQRAAGAAFTASVDLTNIRALVTFEI